MRRKSKFFFKSCWQESQQGQNECQKDSRVGGGKNKFVEEEVSMFDFLHRNKVECEYKLRVNPKGK